MESSRLNDAEIRDAKCSLKSLSNFPLMEQFSASLEIISKFPKRMSSITKKLSDCLPTYILLWQRTTSTFRIRPRLFSQQQIFALGALLS